MQAAAGATTSPLQKLCQAYAHMKGMHGCVKDIEDQHAWQRPISAAGRPRRRQPCWPTFKQKQQQRTVSWLNTHSLAGKTQNTHSLSMH